MFLPLPPGRSPTRKEPLSILPSPLHSLGYYSDGRSTIFLGKLLRGVDGCSRCLSLGLSTAFPSRGWRGAGLANSFKSRCGPGNSTNPLRIHRAPLANSSPLLTSSFPRSLLPLPSRCGFSRVLPSPPLSRRPSLSLAPADPVQVSPAGALRQLLGPLSASPPRLHAVSATGVVGPFRKWLVFRELKFRVVRWTLRLLGTRR